MAENSSIEWCDHTFNPFIGCTKISPGCDNCYAEHLMDKRMHKVVWGPQGDRVRTSPANWREPLRWNKGHAEFFAAHGRRQRVFCASLADVFDNAVDPAWRRDLFDLIELTPNLNWLLLTKRIGNAFEMVARARSHDWLAGRNNVWLGATIVNQEEADRDIPKLLETPARVRFLSMEPLLGPVDLSVIDLDGHSEIYPLKGTRGCEYDDGTSAPDLPEIDWVIVGGESGSNARPMHPQWASALRDQCKAAGVPFLFKQWGQWMPGKKDGAEVSLTFQSADATGPDQPAWFEWPDGQISARVGKKAAGRLLDGSTHDEFPEAT
jgi:protein gp37